jgi:hypothetical protein
MLTIHLAAAATRKAGLLNPEIIRVDNYEGITDINDKVDYLIFILAQVLEVSRDEIKLFIQPDGAWEEETSETWVQVKKEDKIVSGFYLVRVRPGIFGIPFCRFLVVHFRLKLMV